MSELVVGSLKGLSANNFEVAVASGSKLDLRAGAIFPAGAILQVVSTTKTDVFSAAVGVGAFSSEVPGLTASITPSSTSSKILVTFSVNVGANSAGIDIGVRLRRDGSALTGYIGDQLGTNRRRVSSSAITSVNNPGSAAGVYLDSPNTTSPVTYSFDINHASGGSMTVYVNRSNSTDNVDRYTAASTITLMEVAG